MYCTCTSRVRSLYYLHWQYCTALVLFAYRTVWQKIVVTVWIAPTSSWLDFLQYLKRSRSIAQIFNKEKCLLNICITNMSLKFTNRSLTTLDSQLTMAQSTRSAAHGSDSGRQARETVHGGGYQVEKEWNTGRDCTYMPREVQDLLNGGWRPWLGHTLPKRRIYQFYR